MSETGPETPTETGIANQVIIGLLDGVTGKKLSTLSTEDEEAEMIRDASEALLYTDLREPEIGAIKMLIAAGLVGASNPNVIRGLGNATQVDLIHPNMDTINRVIRVASESLNQTPLAESGTKAVKAILAAAIAGAQNQNVINGLTNGVTAAVLDKTTSEKDLASIIRTATDNLEGGVLGQDGTADLKVLIAATVAATQ